jgi:hypothetical protein
VFRDGSTSTRIGLSPCIRIRIQIRVEVKSWTRIWISIETHCGPTTLLLYLNNLQVYLSCCVDSSCCCLTKTGHFKFKAAKTVSVEARGYVIIMLLLPPPPQCYQNVSGIVADPGCLSRIQIFTPDPDFYPSRISDPKTATKERGEKNLLSYLFL